MTTVNQISDFKVERYLLGELPEKEMAALRKRESEDEIFAARVRVLREENEHILKDNPFAVLESKLEEVCITGEELRKSAYGLWLKVAAALVVTVGIFTMVAVNREVSTYDNAASSMEVAMADVDEGTRIKGLDARIEAWKKTGDSAVQMKNLDEAREGDEIQLRYSVPEKCFGMLFSMDGNGTITMHMGDENQAVSLEPGKMTTLPFAYKLDNAPKFEKFFLITSRGSFSIDVGNIDALLKNKDVHVVAITLRKVEK
jgi:hypothetical protein